jgi:hypothetical protein
MIEIEARSDDEFYVGYEERMAPGIARAVRRGVAMFATGAAAAIVVWVLAQHTLPESQFEFGVIRTVAGILRREPYPSVAVDGRRVWLVGPGKFGAEQVVGETPNGPVIVAGSAIQRGPTHMQETNWLRASTEPAQSRHRAGTEPAQSNVTLTGEIVDSKCFLGVMNPGEGTVHRDCARRCLSGGIPPMLIVRGGRGGEELVVLVSAAGRPIGRELARIAGRPVMVTGRLARDGDQYVLYADASDYRLR